MSAADASTGRRELARSFEDGTVEAPSRIGAGTAALVDMLFVGILAARAGRRAFRRPQ